MTQPLSHDFLLGLEDARDRLYALALAKTGSPAAAEQLLLQTARTLFAAFAKGESDPASRGAAGDVPARMAADLGDGPIPDPPPPMPADVWARLAAAVQVEAARSANSKALNPDSVLLRPDPLLAPRRSTPRIEKEEFELSSPSRLILLILLAIAAGIGATYWIVTRPHPGTAAAGSTLPSTREATQPAPATIPASQPATAEAPGRPIP